MIRLRFSVRAVILSMFVSPVVCWKRIQPACHRGPVAAEHSVDALSPHGWPDNSLASVRRRRTPLPAHHARCVFATLLAVVAAPGLVTAQEAPAAAAGPPSPAAAMDAWQTVQGWVRTWTLPPDADGFPAAAACVTLRLNGEVVGRGEDYRADDRSVWRAAMRAMDEAADNAVAGGGVPNDALRDQHLRLLGERMALSVELAGPLTPFSPATYAEAEAALSPGAEGVAVRMGEEIRGLFPAAMLSVNMLPHEALANRAAAVVGNAAAGLEEPGKLAEQHHLVFYRFDTIHLAQAGAGQPPMFLRRGERLILREQMTGAELQRMGQAMAAHLAGRIRTGEEGCAIDEGYRPWLNRYEGEERGAALLLAGIALQSWDRQSPDEAARTAVAAVRAAALEAPTGQPVAQEQVLPLAFGAVLVARELGAGKWPIEQEAAARAWLHDAALALASLYDETSGFASQVRAHEGAPVAWALAEAAAAMPEDGGAIRDVAVSAVRRLYRDTSEGKLVQHMPWLGWAERSLAGDAEQIPAAAALRRMRDHVWEHQVGPLDVEEAGQDVVGGVVFTASSNPLPDWQTLRPVAFAATMLGDGRLTDGPERAVELARLLSSLRFLRQLQVDESQMWMFKDSGASMGGVRAALWDQRMPADATSLGLLTTAETLRSIRALSTPR